MSVKNLKILWIKLYFDISNKNLEIDKIKKELNIKENKIKLLEKDKEQARNKGTSVVELDDKDYIEYKEALAAMKEEDSQLDAERTEE